MNVILYRILQWTWGFPQSLAGFILYRLHKNESHSNFHGAIVSEWNQNGSISLGMFIFIQKNAYANLYRKHSKQEMIERLIVHEYGHTIQSLLLGPSYLLLIGLPSFLWANLTYFHRYRKKKSMSYFSLYTESWANHLGEKITKKKSMENIFID